MFDFDYIKKTCYSYCKMDKETRRQIAKKASENVLTYFNRLYGEERFLDMYFLVFSVFCCANGYVNESQFILFNDIFGTNHSFSEFYKEMKDGNSYDSLYTFKYVVKERGDDYRKNLLTLAICVLSSDGVVDDNELAFLKKYFVN